MIVDGELSEIKAGTVTLDNARYALMTTDTLDSGKNQWIIDTDIKGKALILPFRATCFEPGIIVQVFIEGRSCYRKLAPINLQENEK